MILVKLTTIVSKMVLGAMPNETINCEAKSTTNIRAHIDKKCMEGCKCNFESNQKLVKSRITQSASLQLINAKYFYIRKVKGVGG